ncbi:MAG: hypothetical protein HCTETUND1_125 [Candidatus Hodgkinia cicadicola]|nr:MAG: hypothetical protein HCTETUND1_125 [Candidatus Hodgkinia cicadicola]
MVWLVCGLVAVLWGGFFVCAGLFCGCCRFCAIAIAAARLLLGCLLLRCGVCFVCVCVLGLFLGKLSVGRCCGACGVCFFLVLASVFWQT